MVLVLLWRYFSGWLPPHDAACSQTAVIWEEKASPDVSTDPPVQTMHTDICTFVFFFFSEIQAYISMFVMQEIEALAYQSCSFLFPDFTFLHFLSFCWCFVFPFVLFCFQGKVLCMPRFPLTYYVVEMVLNVWSSCTYFTSAGITGMPPYLVYFTLRAGPRALCFKHTLEAELHP